MKQLIHAIEHMTRDFEELENSALEQSEFAHLSHRQIHYLDVIHELGHPTLGELASELRLSKPSVTMIVRKLEENSFIERVQSDEDRRVAHLHLSEKGMQIAAWHDKVHAEMAKYLVKNLSAKEAQSLEALLDKAVFGGSK